MTSQLDEESLTILVADDKLSIRRALEAILKRCNHRVLQAENGFEVVEAFQAQSPDMIFMAAEMPLMDGHEATRRIRRLAAEGSERQRLVPIVFMTTASEDAEHLRCLESGGDDFIAKPFSPVLVEARLRAMQRIRRAHLQAWENRLKMESMHAELQQELELASHLLSHITDSSEKEIPGIRVWMKRMLHFCGDALLTAKHPEGGFHALLADFTGHGLSAALGSMPTAEILYQMTSKGCDITEICQEINRKLYRLLPANMFCACCLFHVDPARQRCRLWNGGMPPVYLTDGQGTIVETLKSWSPALGILDEANLNSRFKELRMHTGRHLLAYSDGITEAVDASDHMFGRPRLERAITRVGTGGSEFERVRNAVSRHIGNVPLVDDIALIDIDFDQALAVV